MSSSQANGLEAPLENAEAGVPIRVLFSCGGKWSQAVELTKTEGETAPAKLGGESC